MKNPELPISMTLSESRWGIRYLLFELVFLASLLKLALHAVWPGATGAHLNFLYFSVNFFAVLWIFRRYLLDSVRYTAKHFTPCLLAAAVGFAVYELMTLGLSVVLRILVPDFFNVNDASITATSRENMLLMAIGTVGLVPIVEETLHRGLIFGLFRKRSRVMGYAVSTLVFCAIHVVGYVGYYQPVHLLICFIQYIPAGLVLAFAYERSGSIFAPTLIHMAVNAMGVLSVR